MKKKNAWLVAGLLAVVAPAAWSATGSVSLIDQSGLKYFINTNITFSTTSSASGAMSEASYTGPVAADTLNGGTTQSTLNDSFDGYNTICVSLNNTAGNCATGNANFVIYNKNGPATTISGGREVQFSDQVIGGLTVSRRVFVPTNDSFSRTLNFFTNTTGAPITFTATVANNLGSDSNTKITATSSGDLTATTADTWVASFQNWSGTTSSDVRLCHVLVGPGAAVSLSALNFVDGDDNPFWSYSVTLAPGQTRIIANFVSGQPTRAAAAAKCAALGGPQTSSSHMFDNMTATEKSQVANFVTTSPGLGIKGGAMGVDFLLVGLGALGLSRRRRRQHA